MDLEHYDEFGNYIGPDLPSSDSEESGGEPEPSEMPLVPTGVVEEGKRLHTKKHNSVKNRSII